MLRECGRDVDQVALKLRYGRKLLESRVWSVWEAFAESHTYACPTCECAGIDALETGGPSRGLMDSRSPPGNRYTPLILMAERVGDFSRDQLNGMPSALCWYMCDACISSAVSSTRHRFAEWLI